MKSLNHHQSFELFPVDNQRLAKLCGQYNTNLRQIERHLGVEISNRGHQFSISGNLESVDTATTIIQKLYEEAAQTEHLAPETVHLHLTTQDIPSEYLDLIKNESTTEITIRTKAGLIKGRTPHQKIYLEQISSHAINFGIGPAGSGKTYLAVACAVAALEQERVNRIVLVRPVVEAGERLGFLPGDLSQKVDPYFKPLFDALNEMLGAEKVNKLIERHAIEVAPLAYMRGRTLNDSFIILDESQNTTREQMKMFLTRLGFNSAAVITGDITQVDLPRGVESGLKHALEVLKNVEGISFTHFDTRDVVRHPLVQSIVTAYERYENNTVKKS